MEGHQSTACPGLELKCAAMRGLLCRLALLTVVHAVPAHSMAPLQNKLGGGEGVEGLYGSIKKSGMDKVVECMAAKCGLDSRSVMVDIGAGLGRWGSRCAAHSPLHNPWHFFLVLPAANEPPGRTAQLLRFTPPSRHAMPLTPHVCFCLPPAGRCCTLCWSQALLVLAALKSIASSATRQPPSASRQWRSCGGAALRVPRSWCRRRWSVAP